MRSRPYSTHDPPCRLTTRWSRPAQPGVWIWRDTRLGLAGRLISRPLGAQGDSRTGIQDMIVTHDLRPAAAPRGAWWPVISLNGRVGERGLCPRAHFHELSFRPVLELPVRDTPAGLRQRLPSLPTMPIPKHSISRLTTRWSRPGQPGLEFGAIIALACRAAHLEAVRQPG